MPKKRTAKVVTVAATIAMAALVVRAALVDLGLAGDSANHLVVFVSGDSRGYLEPCGCRIDQAGGLPARATVIREVAPRGRLVVDIGNMTEGTRAYELIKLRYLLEGMSKIGYDAVNVGRTEAELDLPTLRSTMKASGLPFVTANVVDKKTGLPVADPFIVVRRGAVRIGITGVASAETGDIGPGVEVRPPIESLASVIPDLKARCDYIIVLAYVGDDDLMRIADQFPEVRAVLGGDVPESSNTAVIVNRAVLFSVTGHGKVIGRIDFTRAGSSYDLSASRGVKMATDTIKPDPEMLTLIAGYKNELRNRRYELASAEGMELISTSADSADQYVGEAACVRCHASAHVIASKTLHARAFATLVAKNSEFDPECLRCHTVGYGLYTGFVDATTTPGLENVQCESCHGRGKYHIEQMEKQAALTGHIVLGSLKPGASNSFHEASTLNSVTPSTCLRCHDQDNSANFNYATFLPKIAH